MSARRQAVTIARNLFPRVSIYNPHAYHGSYKNFVKGFNKSKGSKETFTVLDKAQIDAEFERQVREAVSDESIVQRYMMEGVRRYCVADYNMSSVLR